MKRRHVLAVLGLSFLTLGIYVIYWLYKTRLELLPYLEDKKFVPRVIVLFVPIFVMIGLLIPAAVFMADSWNPYLDEPSAAGMTVFMTVLFGGMLAAAVISFWWFYRYFKAVEAVTGGNNAMLMYGLWIALSLIGIGPVWTLIIQDDLNKFIDNNYQPLKPPVPGNPATTHQAAPARTPSGQHNLADHAGSVHHRHPTTHPRSK
jgi:hypothetical protein